MKNSLISFMLAECALGCLIHPLAQARQGQPEARQLYNPKLPDFSKIEITTT